MAVVDNHCRDSSKEDTELFTHKDQAVEIGHLHNPSEPRSDAKNGNG